MLQEHQQQKNNSCVGFSLPTKGYFRLVVCRVTSRFVCLVVLLRFSSNTMSEHPFILYKKLCGTKFYIDKPCAKKRKKNNNA